MGMTINVTAKDIRDGARGCGDGPCPVELAMKRATGCAHVVVDPLFLRWRGRAIDTPMAVVRFMWAFDAGDAVQPFTFTLDGDY